MPPPPLTPKTNEFGQRVGFTVPSWTPPPHPGRASMQGRYCRLEAMSEQFAPALSAAYAADDDANWTYLMEGPTRSEDGYREWIVRNCLGDNPLFHVIIDEATDRAAGVAAYMRIDPPNGSIEVGHVHFSRQLQRSPAATEAMYLMMKRVFELGYRRYEWKCDALNAPSRAAAQRLGFSYEGVFRQAVVYKGRNRDTAWYAVIDQEWPALARAFERWLDPANFDSEGRQHQRLSDLTKEVLVRRG